MLRLRRPENLFRYRGFTATNRYPRIFGFIQQQLAAQPDVRLLSFGGSTGAEVFTLRDYFPTAFIKGIDINPRSIATCEHLIRFADFERQVTDFARCLKDGGFCVIRHTKFRFADTHVAAGFEPVLQVVRKPPDKTTPLFDRNNCRLMDAVYSDVVFRKCLGSYG